MAVTDQQKIDFLLKKIGFTKTKTGSVVGTGAISGTGKQPFAEAIPSPLIIANGALWNESDSIPTTPPGSDTAQVKVYLAGTSGLRMTADSTSSGQRAYIAYTTYNNTSSARLTNWIDTQFGSSYLIKVYKGDPNSGGVALSAAGSGSNDGWFFDYSAGVLNFNDTNVPSGVTDTNIYIVGYRYIGQTGAPTPTGGGNFTFDDLNVTGDLDVDGHTNLDNVSVAGVTTFSGAVNIDSSGFALTVQAGNSTIPAIRINNQSGTERGQILANDHLNITAQGNDIIFSPNVSGGTTGNNKFDTGNVEINNDLDVDGHTNLDNVSVAGVTTTAGLLDINAGGQANTFKVEDLTSGRVVLAGTGGELEDSNKLTFDGTTLGLTGNANFTGNLTVGGVLTYEDVKNVDSVGLITARSGIRVTSGVIEAQAGENKIPSLYTAMGNLPSAGSYHGMFAHVHATGRGYFAHAGNWLELVNKETNGTVGTGTETYNIGSLTATGADISGDIDVDGHTNLDNVSVAGVTTFSDDVTFTGANYNVVWDKSTSKLDFDADAQLRFQGNSFRIYNDGSGTSFIRNTSTNLRITSNIFRVRANNDSTNYINCASNTVRLYESGNEKFQTTSTGITVTGTVVADGADINGDLDVDGHTNLDNVSVAGVTTFASNISVGTSIAVGTGVTVETNGQATFTGIVTASSFRGDGSQLSGISVDASALKDSNGNVKIQAQASGAVHTGIATFQDIDVDGHTNLDNVSIAGVTTITSNVLYLKSASGSGPTISAITGSDVLNIASNGFIVKNQNGWKGLEFTGSSIELYSGQMASHKLVLQTNSSGVALPLDLDVDGHTNLDNVSVAGVTTFTGTAEFDGTAKFDSTITAGGGTGSNGQYLKTTGTGVAWASFPTMRTTSTVTASAGQTTFSFTYNVGFLDVFVNGTKLTDSEFTATNGSSVVLAVGCFVGDIVDLISYNTVSGGGGGGAGSITVQDEGSSLSTSAETLNFVGTGIVASGTGSTKTITVNAGTADTTDVRTNTLEVVGVSTFTGAVSINAANGFPFTVQASNYSVPAIRINNSNGTQRGRILADDHFNIEAFGNDIIFDPNHGGGTAGDILLKSNSINALVVKGTGDVDILNTLGIGGSITKASGHLDIRASNLHLKNAAGSATYAAFSNGGGAELYFNNTKRFETTNTGANVVGTLTVNGSPISGGGGSGFFSQTIVGIHTLSKVGIGTTNPEFDLDLGSYISQNVSTASTIRIMGDGASSDNTAIRFGAGGSNVDYTLLRVDGRDGTTDGDGNTDLGFALRYMSAGESGTDNRIAFWADNTNKTKYEALSIYNDGRVLVDNGAGGGHGFYGHPPDHFTVRGSSKLDNVRVVGVSTVQHVLPETDSTYDIGTNTVRVRNIYADTLYGDGSNLTGISGGGGTDVGITTNLSGNFTASPGTPATINTFTGYSSDDLVVEYTVYIKNGSDFQSQKLLAMRDGTTIHSTQFAVMFSSSLLVQCDATISSGNILLRATPESGITGNTTYKIKREVM